MRTRAASTPSKPPWPPPRPRWEPACARCCAGWPHCRRRHRSATPAVRESLPQLASWDGQRELAERLHRVLRERFGLDSLAAHAFARLAPGLVADEAAYRRVERLCQETDALFEQLDALLESGDGPLGADTPPGRTRASPPTRCALQAGRPGRPPRPVRRRFRRARRLRRAARRSRSAQRRTGRGSERDRQLARQARPERHRRRAAYLRANWSPRCCAGCSRAGGVCAANCSAATTSASMPCVPIIARCWKRWRPNTRQPAPSAAADSRRPPALRRGRHGGFPRCRLRRLKPACAPAPGRARWWTHLRQAADPVAATALYAARSRAAGTAGKPHAGRARSRRRRLPRRDRRTAARPARRPRRPARSAAAAARRGRGRPGLRASAAPV